MRPGPLFLSLFLTLWAWAASLPTRPGPTTFVADYGEVLSPQVKSSLARQVQEQNRLSESDLFIITLSSLHASGQSDIQAAAQACFPAWKMKNSDVLLLLSVQERKARIQLGKGWGGRWDLEMQRIMRDVIVPACQLEDYNRAVTQAASRLLVVTARGPEASLPAQNWYEKAENLGTELTSKNLLPWQVGLAMVVVSWLLLLLSLCPVGADVKKLSGFLGLMLAGWSASGFRGFPVIWFFVGFVVLWTISYLTQVGFGFSDARLSSSDPDFRDDDELRRRNQTDTTETTTQPSYEGSWGGDSSGGSDGGGATGSW